MAVPDRSTARQLLAARDPPDWLGTPSPGGAPGGPCLLDPERSPSGWTAICVSVADRRVGLAFMTIAERLDDMAERHPAHTREIAAARGPADNLEAKLAAAAGLSRAALEGRLRAARADGDR